MAMSKSKHDRGFSVKKSELAIAALLFLVAIPIRLQNLGLPSQIIFDEVSFGKYVSDYFARSFALDIHPPLAKLMLAVVAWSTGYQGEFDFDEVGREYTDSVPYLAMRGLGATMGALVVPLAYQTTRDAGYSHMAAIIPSLAICFENGLISNNRLILLDSYLLFFIAFSVFAWNRFCRQVAFSRRWWYWLFLTGGGLGCAVSTKWIGLFTIIFISMCASKQLWKALEDIQMPKRHLATHLVARLICLLGVPFTIYLATFYAHFSIMTRSGSGDGYMAFETQNELKGIPAIDAPLVITYGSLITMRHLNTMGGYLHSHKANYPEGSNQQQVTLYPYKDDNNWWRILRANESSPIIKDVLSNDQQTWLQYVRHNDLVRLEHVKTAPHKLHSHSFYAPVTDSDYHYEVSAYGFEDYEGDSNDFWQVQIEADSEKSESSNQLKARRSRFRLFHPNQNCHLYSTVQRLPEWGYFQQEVSCIVDGLKQTALWSIIDASNSMLPNDTIMIPEHRPGFFEKFLQANKAMWNLHREFPSTEEDPFVPSKWPFLLASRMIYIGDTFQIILLGNPFVFWASTAAVLLSIFLFVVFQLRDKRKCHGRFHPWRLFYEQTAGFFAVAWAVHYLPFLRMDRQLSPHHYMAALYFAVLTMGAVFDLLFKRMPCIIRTVLLFALVSSVIYYYCLLFPITYGTEWTVEECQNATLVSSWDLNCQNYQLTNASNSWAKIQDMDMAETPLASEQSSSLEHQDDEDDEEYEDIGYESDDEEEDYEDEIMDAPTSAPHIPEPEPEFIDGKEVFPEEDEEEDDYWPRTTHGVDPDDEDNPSPFHTRDIPITTYRA
ncbi:Dolichyl-phosphate-mannose-protein mannosyltransferase-domain-containing protein [Choanephora cucurbitarum]|nr:Dolichyl-phosphate-mannose-protein mannosyltransferase-domain-containing protein [Choanephora cucurbitarum]